MKIYVAKASMALDILDSGQPAQPWAIPLWHLYTQIEISCVQRGHDLKISTYGDHSIKNWK